MHLSWVVTRRKAERLHRLYATEIRIDAFFSISERRSTRFVFRIRDVTAPLAMEPTPLFHRCALLQREIVRKC